MVRGVMQANIWDPATIVTAVLAGAAALAGMTAIIMNWAMQRDQQQWQAGQETRRRSWETQQERERRSSQEAQAMGTRWDDYKRRLYGAFISGVDRLHTVSGDLADVRRNIAEDLENHMPMVEDHFLDVEGERLGAMTEEQRQQFWREKYEEQLAWFKERQKNLSEAESQVRSDLSETVGELHLIAPDHIRAQIDELAGVSQQSYFGSSLARHGERDAARKQFIDAVRADLRVPLVVRALDVEEHRG